MTGRIDWGAYNGEDIEKIIAMFIANEYPWQVEQIQPSQGDGGIDILINFNTGINVIQVKKFSSSPDSSQKKQIKKSIDRIISDPRVKEYNILEYYIALPSNITLETKQEIKSYGEDKGLHEINWIDLATIDGWAAKYPEIIDYYLHGQRETITKRAQDLAQFFLDLRDKDLSEHFKDFQKFSDNLNKISPHYEYYLSSTPAPEDSTELHKFIQERPVKNLVYSQFLINNDKLIILDTVAKNNLSTTMEPIKFSGFFTNMDKNVEDFIKYGSPLNSDKDNFILSDKIPNSVMDSEEQVVKLKTNPIVSNRENIIINILNEDNDLISDLELRNNYITSGISKEGLEYSFIDKTESFELIIRFNLKENNQYIIFNFSPKPNFPIDDIYKAFKVFADLSSGLTFKIFQQYNASLSFENRINVKELPENFYTTTQYTYIKALKSLQEFATFRIDYINPERIQPLILNKILDFQNLIDKDFIYNNEKIIFHLDNSIEVKESALLYHLLIPSSNKIDWFGKEISVGFILTEAVLIPTESINGKGQRKWDSIPGIPTLTRNLSKEQIEFYKSKEPNKLRIFGTYYSRSKKINNHINFWLPLNLDKIEHWKK